MDAATRSFVSERAGFRCEYCRLHRDHQGAVQFHIEHIIARQHQGGDSPTNLAFSCHRCNLDKGTNLVSRAPQTGQVTPLFNPRKQNWTEHFELRNGEIVGLTAIGRTSATLLRMNTPDRIELRLYFMEIGLWES